MTSAPKPEAESTESPIGVPVSSNGRGAGNPATADNEKKDGSPSVPEYDGNLHFLISELRDENSRSRLREAVWISIILHLVFLFFLKESPRLLFRNKVALVSQADLLKNNRQLTFLDLPPDLQKLAKRPQTDKISDKDRIATSKNPRLDPRILEQLRDNRRPGPPAPNQPQQAQAPPQAAQRAGQQNNQSSGSPRPQNQGNQEARLRQPVPDTTNLFHMGDSAGSAIQQAARASSQARGGRVGGEYGSGPGTPNTAVQSDLEILSDTMGVDFGPYLQRVLQSVRVNWYNLIPEVARPPLMKQGKVAIQFAITREGAVAGMRLIGPSGDVSLDRAAWGGITASNPFPPLPAEFRGQYLALRFHFFYNPERNELR